jgi:tubulin---tyrosine ligase
LRLGKDIFNVVPLTFHITKGVEDAEFSKFETYFDSQNKQGKGKGNRNVWIIKPGENSNRGNGISVSNNLA